MSTSQVAVFDDVLPPDRFESLWGYVQAEDYTYGRGTWAKAFRLGDGRPAESALVVAGDTASRVSAPRRYPTGTGIDFVIEVLLERAHCFAAWIGERGEVWSLLTARTSLFARDVALSWHEDTDPRSGSYAYYAHPRWNIEWGGHLLVGHDSTRHLRYPAIEVPGQGRQPVESALDNVFQSEELLREGYGTWIAPKPNRLVILAGGSLHAVGRVDPDAGQHVRCSIAGFFLRAP